MTVNDCALYTIPDAARILRIGPDAVRSLVRRKHLASTRPNPRGWRYVTGLSIRQYIEGLGHAPQAALTTTGARFHDLKKRAHEVLTECNKHYASTN